MLYSKKRVINRAIPDNDPNGMSDTIKFHRNLTVKDVVLNINIKHPYAGDISINLVGPNGKSVQVLAPGRGPGKNLDTSFSGDMMNIFNGSKSKGDWSIKVVDSGPKDSGKVVDWSLDFELANSKKSEVFIKDDVVLSSSQICHQGGSISDITAKVKVEHGHIGDLILDLTSPSGKVVTIHNKAGGNGKFIEKSYDAKVLAEFIGEKAKGKWTIKINDTMPRDAGNLISWGLNIRTTKVNAADMSTVSGKIFTGGANKKDDLKKIEGIGPKIESLLNDGGILTWNQLASAKVSNIKAILSAAGARYQMHDPTTWPTQSELAAKGEWAALEKLQDELDGGK